MKILIADDHMGMRNMLRSLITLALPGSAEIVECESGEQAVALAASELPRLVLMDYQFRQSMNGFEAIRAIQHHDPHVKILMVTSFDTPAFRARAEELGIEGFICKENLSELTTLLQSLTHS